mgnify:CR=1 FL=1
MSNLVSYIALNRPEVGAIMHRYALNGLYEQAAINSIIGPENHPERWTAVLMTRNGVEFVSSSAEHRNRCDWVPVDWTYDEVRHCWVMPEDDDTVVGAPVTPRMTFDDIPKPKADERYMAWRARVYREVDGIKEHPESPDLMKTVWASRTALPTP